MRSGYEAADAYLDEFGITDPALRLEFAAEGRIRSAMIPGTRYSDAVEQAGREYVNGRADWNRYTAMNSEMIRRENAARNAR